jgi:hypothetical protein
MLMLTTYLQDLIVSGTIVYVTYCFMRVTAYGVLWLIEILSFKQGDRLHGYAERTLSHVGEEGVGSGQASAFPILGEANHASVE